MKLLKHFVFVNNLWAVTRSQIINESGETVRYLGNVVCMHVCDLTWEMLLCMHVVDCRGQNVKPNPVELMLLNASPERILSLACKKYDVSIAISKYIATNKLVFISGT